MELAIGSVDRKVLSYGSAHFSLKDSPQELCFRYFTRNCTQFLQVLSDNELFYSKLCVHLCMQWTDYISCE